jgi:cell division transport system permease protein
MSIFFSFSEGVKGILKTRMASILSISSITLTLLLLGIFAIFTLNLKNWIGLIREKIEIEVFIELTASEQDIVQLQKQINQIDGLADINYINKEQAANRFKEETGQDIYEILDYNPFPASLIITLKEDYRLHKKVIEIKSKIEKLNFIDEVVYKKNLLEAIDRYINIIFIAIIVASLIIIFIASVLIYNTIRLTIYARRDIIQIMRLVGATEGFVKRPFIFEGILQGLIGAIFAIIILYYVSKGIQIFIYPYLLYDIKIFLALILFGFLIGMLSSYFSVGKYLRNI